MRSYFWPKTVVWETTLRCNMRCLHCGSIAGDARPNEMSTEEVLDVCQQLVDIGTETVILSGGETFMRSDWPQIAEALLQGGVKLGIITNGVQFAKQSSIRKTLITLTKQYGTITIGLSLDGMEAAHDGIRGIPGSFKQVLHCIDLAHQDEIPVVLLTTVNGKNFDDLIPLRELIFELAPYAWQIQTCSVYGRMKERRDWLLTESQYIQLVDFLAENRRLRPKNPRTDPADCIGYYTGTEDDLRDTPWAGCQAGIRGIGIESNGNIKGCLSLLDPVFIEGNLRDNTLAEIWDRPGSFTYNRDFSPDKLEGMCKDCEHGKQCVAGCRGVAHSVTGSFHSAPFCVHGFRFQNRTS